MSETTDAIADDAVEETVIDAEDAVEEVEEGNAGGSETAAVELNTTPFDPRFPQTNQAKHCYTRYNEFHKCQAENGEGAEECEPLGKFYRAICPAEWVEKWNEQREEGTWPGRY